MRIVFVFVSCGGADKDNIPTWNPKQKAQNKYIGEGGLETEGLFWMLRELKKEGIIKDILTFIESNRTEETGRFEVQGVKGYVVPHISCIEPLLKKGDVLFIRGGWRGWHDWLKSLKGRYPLILYPANTGRERWGWWDIILDDYPRTTEMCCDEIGRTWIPFRKPTNEDVFTFDPEAEVVYDLCIGASRLHDKKGQWRAVEVVEQYYKEFGAKLRCIMPGPIRHGTKTSKALEKARELGIEIPGNLPRQDLCKVFNSTKIFMHLGTSGQNDRGPIEALCCGCSIILGSPQYHSPFVTKHSLFSSVLMDAASVSETTKDLRDRLKGHRGLSTRKANRANYRFDLGRDVVLESMKSILETLY